MRRITLIIICSFLSILIIGTSCQKSLDNSVDILNGINGIKNQNDSLLQLTLKLQKSLDSMQNQVNLNTNILNSINSKVTVLQISIDTLISSIKQMGSKIDTVNNNLTLLQTQVNTLAKQYLNLSSQISSVFATISLKIDSLSLKIGANTSLLNTLQTEYLLTQIKVDSILLAIQTNNQLLSTANTNITQIQQQLILLTSEYNNVITLLNQLIGLINAQNTLSSLANGLVAYYPFTGNANDSSGSGYNGIVTGVTFTSDRFGNPNSALYFNNTGDVSVPRFTFQNYVTTGFTISYWVTMEDSTTNSRHFVMANYDGVNGVEIEYDVTPASNPLAIIRHDLHTNTANPISIDWTTPITTFNTWKHYVLVWSPPNMISYQNGVLMNSQSNVQINNLSSSLITRFGNLNGNSGSYYKGKIDDIRVYNRVLTQSEINFLSQH
jgi:predicted  nucleic acid-binding Zn-ribbon protein